MTGNEEVSDLTQLEALMAQTASGRMANVMQGSVQRFRSSSTRRKKLQAPLDDQSDEENGPVSVERSAHDSAPSPRSRVMHRTGSGLSSNQHHKPLWESFPDKVSVPDHPDAAAARAGYAVYVPLETENASKEPAELDYYSKTSAYCYHDHKFQPIKSEPEKPRAPRSPETSRTSRADLDELEDELDLAVYEETDEPLQEDAEPQDRKVRPTAKTKVLPKPPVEPAVKLSAWEDEDDVVSVSNVLGGFVSSAAATLGLGEDKSVKDKVALDTLLQAKAQRPAAQLKEADRGAGT